MINSLLCSPTDAWEKFTHPYTKQEFGKWELILPPKHDNSPAVDHNSKLKVEKWTSLCLVSHTLRVSSCRGATGIVIAMCERDSLLCTVSYGPSENLAGRRQQHVILTACTGEKTVCTQGAQWRVDTPEEPDVWQLFHLLSAAGIPQDIVPRWSEQNTPLCGGTWLVFSSCNNSSG